MGTFRRHARLPTQDVSRSVSPCGDAIRKDRMFIIHICSSRCPSTRILVTLWLISRSSTDTRSYLRFKDKKLDSNLFYCESEPLTPHYTSSSCQSSLRRSSPLPFDSMAHLDVVPATTSLDRWTYPPFDGRIADDWVYGRGTTDCKTDVVGILTALEYMLRSGWRPKRTFCE